MLHRWLEDQPDLTVVAEVADSDAAISEAARLQPDLAVLDIDMPGQLCFEAARQIRQQSPATRLVFLSAFSHDRYIEQALAVNAQGYLTKDEPVENVIEALRTIASGASYYSPHVQARLLVDERGRCQLNPQPKTHPTELTRREIEILHYIGRGMSNKEVAAATHLAVRTVETHCARLTEKLGIRGRVELARYAIREGLCQP